MVLRFRMSSTSFLFFSFLINKDPIPSTRKPTKLKYSQPILSIGFSLKSLVNILHSSLSILAFALKDLLLQPKCYAISMLRGTSVVPLSMRVSSL